MHTYRYDTVEAGQTGIWMHPAVHIQYLFPTAVNLEEYSDQECWLFDLPELPAHTPWFVYAMPAKGAATACK